MKYIFILLFMTFASIDTEVENEDVHIKKAEACIEWNSEELNSDNATCVSDPGNVCTRYSEWIINMQLVYEEDDPDQ